MQALTQTQKEVFAFLKSYASKYGMPPTRKEISKGFGWSSWNSAQCHLKAIASKGYIRLLDGKVSRGIIILK